MRWSVLGLLVASACASPSTTPKIHVLGAPRAAQASVRPEPAVRWAFRRETVARERTDVRVLLYHSFGWFSDMRPAVSPHALKTQLDWLERQQIEVIPLGALLDYLDGTTELPARACVITIDDGELNGFSVAFPIFRERGIPFTLALATEAIERTATRGTIPWATLREMLDSGLVSIGSHSHTHKNLTALGDAELRRELEHPRALLERELGVRAEAFFYPLGAHDERVRQAAADVGYRAAFAARGGPLGHDAPRFALPRYAVEQSTHLFAFAHYFRHGSARAR